MDQPGRNSATRPIGGQIRALRKLRKMSTTALAMAIGKSAGFVNNVENGRTEVTITSLKKIGDVLGVQISWFFQGFDADAPEEVGHVVRREHRRILHLDRAGITEELLSPTIIGECLLTLTTFEPGAGTGDEPIVTEGEMTGLVLSGELRLTIGEKQFMLREGDSFTIPRGVPHHSHNPGEVASRSLWAVTPPAF